MITTTDIQLSLRSSSRRIDLTPLATELIANLLNDFIYEYKDRELRAILDRHRRALEFVFTELSGILADAAGTLQIEQQVSAIDVLHWIAPRWQAALKGLGFVFDKE